MIKDILYSLLCFNTLLLLSIIYNVISNQEINLIANCIFSLICTTIFLCYHYYKKEKGE